MLWRHLALENPSTDVLAPFVWSRQGPGLAEDLFLLCPNEGVDRPLAPSDPLLDALTLANTGRRKACGR